MCARKTRDGAGGMAISVWTVDSSGGSAGAGPGYVQCVSRYKVFTVCQHVWRPGLCGAALAHIMAQSASINI